MVILRFRTGSDAKDLLKKLKKMHKFSKELIECVESRYEDEEDDLDFRNDDWDDEESHMARTTTRYRRGRM